MFIICYPEMKYYLFSRFKSGISNNSKNGRIKIHIISLNFRFRKPSFFAYFRRIINLIDLAILPWFQWII